MIHGRLFSTAKGCNFHHYPASNFFASEKRPPWINRPYNDAKYSPDTTESKLDIDIIRWSHVKERQLATEKKKAKTLESWEHILDESITTVEELSKLFEINKSQIRRVISSYPMLINRYYLSLIKNQGDPLYRQAVPDIKEKTHTDGFDDPLNEDELSPVPGLIHKYPDRVLFFVSSKCAVYCRFCNRKRMIGRSKMVTKETIQEGISYIRSKKKVRDVLLSGGDPLLLSDKELFNILSAIRDISHVEIIRIGTRIPCTLPQRITPKLTSMLSGFHPLYINTHFNHPSEITVEASSACSMLTDAGIPIGCQTVLLKGINENPSIMKDLLQKLLIIRVRPYYLFQADLVRGTSHFWTPLSKGIAIIESLQGYTSGLCIPHFVIDLPKGGGKIPITPKYIKGREGDDILINNYLKEEHHYPIINT